MDENKKVGKKKTNTIQKFFDKQMQIYKTQRTDKYYTNYKYGSKITENTNISFNLKIVQHKLKLRESESRKIVLRQSFEREFWNLMSGNIEILIFTITGDGNYGQTLVTKQQQKIFIHSI